jgi:hypothetical protein
MSSFGGVIAGALASGGPGGWRYIFWIEAALHFLASAGLLILYNPPRPPYRPKLALRTWVWQCDPVGSILFITAMTLLLVVLNWGGRQYAWSDPIVIGCLSAAVLSFLVFIFYGKLRLHLRTIVRV